MKRAFDITCGTVGLVLASPLLALIALLIIVTDGRPIFFIQDRIGIHGSRFPILKFRTMSVANDRPDFEPGQKARVTGVGRLLRKSKLDELPQLWNVIVGQMSLVGPRPEVPQWVQAYPERWARIHQIRPGITDPAAIVYRNEEEILAAADDPDEAYRTEILPRKLELYEQYVDSRSFVGDLRILLQTCAAVVYRGRTTESP